MSRAAFVTLSGCSAVATNIRVDERASSRSAFTRFYGVYATAARPSYGLAPRRTLLSEGHAVRTHTLILPKNSLIALEYLRMRLRSTPHA